LVAIVTRYGVLSTVQSSLFLLKCLFVTCFSKKVFNFGIFYTFSLSNFEQNYSKVAATIAANLKSSVAPASPQPVIIALSCRAHHRLSTKSKIFSKYCNTVKILGGCFNPFDHVGNMSSPVRPKVNIIDNQTTQVPLPHISINLFN